MKVKDVLGWLDGLAPFDSAEDFDNVGLLLGDEEAAVRGVTFGMDDKRLLGRRFTINGL